MNSNPAFDAVSDDLPAAAREISKRELVNYVLRTPASEKAMARAERVMPLGVASSFQFYEPHPLVMKSAAGSRMEDLDGHEYVDFTMGYGALFTWARTSDALPRGHRAARRRHAVCQPL